MNTNKLSIFYICIILLLGLMTTAIASVYFPLAVSIPLNILIPIAVILIFRPPILVTIKLITLVIGGILMVLAVLNYFTPERFVIVMIWLLRINMLEAVLLDLYKKNFFNAISGLLLIGASALFEARWYGFYYLMSPATIPLIFWIVAYTIWNYNFILLTCDFRISLYHISVLAAPLALLLITHNPGFWLVFRAPSLTHAVTLQAVAETNPYLLDPLHSKRYEYYSNKIKNKKIQMTLAVIILGLSILTVLKT